MTGTSQHECFELRAKTANDLMTVNPISIAETMTVRDAAAVFTDKEISAVPVINEAGRPVGVLTRSDITRHESSRIGLGIASVVREIMTPTVFSVPKNAPVVRVLSDFLAFKVHHLFVVDEDGILVGVISTFDVLRRIGPTVA